MVGALHNPTKRPSQIALLALCCKNSSAARGRLQRLAAHDILHRGEARRKRLQLRTKSTKTRSSPRQFWNSRSRSSILNGAPVRQLAMHWATGEQWLLPLLHSSRGAWLKPCPWLGIDVRLASPPPTALFTALFAAASSPPHPPMHPRPALQGQTQVIMAHAPDLVALHPRPNLSPLSYAAAAGRPPCRHSDRTAVAVWCCVWPWLRGCAECLARLWVQVCLLVVLPANDLD